MSTSPVSSVRSTSTFQATVSGLNEAAVQLAVVWFSEKGHEVQSNPIIEKSTDDDYQTEDQSPQVTYWITTTHELRLHVPIPPNWAKLCLIVDMDTK